MPVSKKIYVGLIRDLAGDLQAFPRRAEDTTEKGKEPKAKVSELGLEVQLLTEEAGHAGDLQKLSETKTNELELVGKDLKTK